MSEAPERIWADGNAEWDSGSWGCNKEYDEDVEYIRTDLVRAQIEAAVKRALEGAGKYLDEMALQNGYTKTPRGRTAMFYARKVRALDSAQFIDGDKP